MDKIMSADSWNRPHWHALYTKSRHEKFIREELSKKNIESFLPLRRIKRKWSDRTQLIEEPLFKSYLFVHAAWPQFNQVLSSKGAVSLVSAGSKPIAIENEVIHSLKTVVEQNMAVDPFPYVDEGDRVFVKSGLFKGIEGFVFRKDSKKCRLVISVRAVMASLSVEVDAYDVEKI